MFKIVSCSVRSRLSRRVSPRWHAVVWHVLLGAVYSLVFGFTVVRRLKNSKR